MAAVRISTFRFLLPKLFLVVRIFICHVSIQVRNKRNDEELLSKAKELLSNVVENGYEKAKRRHTDRWKERWAKADIEIKGDEELQQGIRYNIFQLFSTYYGGDI